MRGAFTLKDRIYEIYFLCRTGEIQRNKGGKILKQIEKIKETHRGELSEIEINNLWLHRAKEGVSDFKMMLCTKKISLIKIKLENILSSIFPEGDK